MLPATIKSSLGTEAILETPSKCRFLWFAEICFRGRRSSGFPFGCISNYARLTFLRRWGSKEQRENGRWQDQIEHPTPQTGCSHEGNDISAAVQPHAYFKTYPQGKCFISNISSGGVNSFNAELTHTFLSVCPQLLGHVCKQCPTHEHRDTCF